MREENETELEMESFEISKMERLMPIAKSLRG